MIRKTIYLIPECDLIKGGKVLLREASRAIIIRNGKILLVYSNKNGDYKFPGGGIEYGESKEEALVREVEEEVGLHVTKIYPMYAHVTTFNNETISQDFDVFKMDSYYYFCDVGDENIGVNLSETEFKLGFESRWVKIDDAINANEEILESDLPPLWTKRETTVMQMLSSDLSIKC